MKIGEVNRRTGLTDKTIRFYERRGLISVPHGENRYRDYDTETVARLVRIKRMRELGIPVADIRLWCDGIVSTQEMIRRRQRELENEDAFNQRQQALCHALLNGTPFDLPESDFTEPELELDPAVPAGKQVSRHAAYICMDRLAEQPPQNLPEVDTCFCGTRADPSARGAIRGLEVSNFTPAHLICGVLYGMVRELRELYDAIRPGTPPQRVVVSGNAIRRNPALCRIVGELFNAPVLVTCHTEEAAFGAALYAAAACGIADYGQARSFIRYQTDKTTT